MSKPKAGMVIVHRSGSVHVLDRRKNAMDARKGNGAGWWLVDGSGLSDGALASGDWCLLDDDAINLLFGASRTTGETTE